ncbi:MAG: formate dehydrogenase accessory sulfurtransferase FdhD [candidate division WOR-3 bacterium]
MIDKRKILRVQNDRISEEEDFISIEEIVGLYINKQLLTRNSISPSNLKEWAVGYLYSSGLIKWDQSVKIEFSAGDVYVESDLIPSASDYVFQSSSCTGGMEQLCFKGLTPLHPPFNFRVEISKLFSIYEKFNAFSNNFKLSGSLHAAGISDGEQIQFFAEDVGRHNAVDKVIGMAFLSRFDLTSSILLTTGRISLEIVKKCIVARIPAIVSRSAPTTFAIDLAKNYNVTLIGFLRGKRCNIYCNFLFKI